MSVTRKRLQDIVELAQEAEMEWRGVKTSSLAFWLRDVAKAVLALDEEAERFDAEIGALSDAVDQIDDRIDGIVGEVNDEPDPLDLEAESDGTDLTAAPQVVDYYLDDNEARIVGGTLHVGPAFRKLWLEMMSESQAS